MSEARRKLWLYLYPDEPHQKATIEAIERVSLRQRPDFFRDSLIAGVALSTLDTRLPALLALLLDGSSDAHTLNRVLRLVLPGISTEQDCLLETVGWQKRVRDELTAGRPWSAWFPISEAEYDQQVSLQADDSEVRALLALAQTKSQPQPDQVPGSYKENPR